MGGALVARRLRLGTINPWWRLPTTVVRQSRNHRGGAATLGL